MKQSSERAIIQRSVPDDLLIRQRNGKPRIFRVERWSLVEKIDTNGISDLAQIKRSGLVLVDSHEKAFKRGIPFFVSGSRETPLKASHA